MSLGLLMLCALMLFPSGSNFTFGSSAQQFVVPSCVTSIHELLSSGSGGSGGKGGFVGSIPVSRGDVFTYIPEAGGGCSFCMVHLMVEVVANTMSMVVM